MNWRREKIYEFQRRLMYSDVADREEGIFIAGEVRDLWEQYYQENETKGEKANVKS